MIDTACACLSLSVSSGIPESECISERQASISSRCTVGARKWGEIHRYHPTGKAGQFYSFTRNTSRRDDDQSDLAEPIARLPLGAGRAARPGEGASDDDDDGGLEYGI